MTQLSLFDTGQRVTLKATIAVVDGKAFVSFCTYCGLTLCSATRSRDLGPCPNCEHRTWKNHDLPVSIFRGVVGAE